MESSTELPLEDSPHEDDAFDLPPPPEQSHQHSSTPDFPAPLTKRRRIPDHNTTSSDPPLFSSDGPQPVVGAENYIHDFKRRKTRYRGTWWGEKQQAPPTRHENGKRKFARNMDSGVWMGSESTDDSFDDEFIKAVDQGVTTVQPAAAAQRSFGSKRVYENTASPAEREADAVVQRCLDEGRETVDLSGLNLVNLPGYVLRPLQTLTKEPAIDAPPASQEEYDSFEPRLCLFLANNELSRLPNELFNLTNITVLSLRGNNLDELPSSIGRLRNLEELNVAFNKLRYLPWEIVELCRGGRLQRISMQPNPFEKPDMSTFRDVVLESTTEGKPQCVARGEVTWFDKHGLVWKQPRKGDLHMTSETVDRSRNPRTRSLLELAIQECARSPFLSELSSLINDDGPENVVKLVDLAVEVEAAGGRNCSVCGRSYIIPRTEWLECWNLKTSRSSERGNIARNYKMGFAPILRRGCSWDCVAE